MSKTESLAWRNWAGNHAVTATALARPRSAAEVAELVRSVAAAGGTLKPTGSGHSFTSAAVTTGTRVQLGQLARLVNVDRAARRVTVGAGTTLSVLNATLAEHGLAMPNLGDIDAQTISGALATGTHGTGRAYGCLSTFIEELELVTGTGEVVRCSATERPDVFAAARVGVGAVGVVTEVTLRCSDAFILHADEKPEQLDAVLASVDERVATHDHFEFFWMPYTTKTLTKSNNRVAADTAPRSRFSTWFNDDLLENTVIGGVCRVCRAVPQVTPTMLRTVARFFSPRNYTERSDLVFTSPRRVRFMEMEYGVPREALSEVFAGLRRIIDRLSVKVTLPVEVRFTAADDIWLSHGYGRDNAYVAIHQFIGLPYESYFRAFEQLCASLGGRPHWGKMHFRTAEDLRPAYPRFDDFLSVRDTIDPERVFANDYTRQIFGP